MRFHEQAKPSLFPLVSLLTLVFLLCAGPAFADPRGKSHGGPYAGGDGERYSGYDKSPKRMHSSGYGKGSMKGHDGYGSGAMHERAHKKAMKFIKHILKSKDGMSLTEEQVQQLRDLKINYKKNRIRMKADADIAQVDLHVLLWDEKAKLSDIEAQMNTVHGLKTKLHMASIKARRDAKAVLTEEQRARIAKMHERIKSHGKKAGHPGDSSKDKKCKKGKGHEIAGDKK